TSGLPAAAPAAWPPLPFPDTARRQTAPACSPAAQWRSVAMTDNPPACVRSAAFGSAPLHGEAESAGCGFPPDRFHHRTARYGDAADARAPPETNHCGWTDPALSTDIRWRRTA